MKNLLNFGTLCCAKIISCHAKFRHHYSAFSKTRHPEPQICHSELVSESLTDYKETLKLVQGDRKAAFSLVELLMALLVASLLMTALAPVMTRKFTDNVNVTGNMNPAGTVKKTVEIEYNSTDCSDIKTASDGSQYCEGEFEVPGGYNGMMKITLVGAGGGGAAASTAGYTEFTTVGETNNFKVPNDVNEIEATLVSGGAGGGAGGQIMGDADFSSSDGKFSWTPADIAVNKYVNVTGCGGGGGGAGQRGRVTEHIGGGTGGGGGSGAYGSATFYVSNKNPWEIHIGGGGGGGSRFRCDDGNNGGYFAGGGGGGGNWVTDGQLGFGGGAGTETGGAGGKGCATNDDSLAARIGVSATPAGGGAGGAGTTTIRNGQRGKGPAGGAGGAYAGGGGGGAMIGQAAGGGGGGATRLIINNTLAAIWPGGGGGGASSGCNSSDGSASNCYIGGAGGGGGGAGGGKGGDAVDTWYGNTPLPPHRTGTPGLGGHNSTFTIKADGAGAYGGKINVENYAFGDENCHGGDSFESSADVAMGKNGKRGALKISYLDYGISGGGGGGAGMVPLRKVSVTPGETLKIKVGRGGKGGTTGLIQDNGTIKQPAAGEDAWSNTAESGCVITRLSKANGTVLITTSYSTNYAGPLAGATNGGTFPYHSGGAISDGKATMPNANGPVVVAGFTNTSGGKGTQKSAGGNGGSATTPFTGTCEPGKGGTAGSPNGTNATGYGCGGGGGYSYFGNGGAGSSGYARISWNKYYDTAQKLYKLAETGAGGGGASGNVFSYSIVVKSNEIFTFRIGKGGNGGNGSFAQSSNDDDLKKLNGTKGGDTIFALNTPKQLSAGGGGGGIYPTVNTSLGNKLINGRGGAISNVCTYNGKSYLNTEKYCTKGLVGNDAQNNIGGAGADFKTYTVKVVDSTGKEVEKQISGTGGLGGIAGANSHGGHSENSHGAGGGGAGLWDLGEVSSNGMSNPTRGGNGSNGKIIIEWYEVKGDV